jgi:hypothetical protein
VKLNKIDRHLMLPLGVDKGSNNVEVDHDKKSDDDDHEEYSNEDDEEDGDDDEEKDDEEHSVVFVGEAHITTARRFPEPFIENRSPCVSSAKEENKDTGTKKFSCHQCQKEFRKRKYVDVIMQVISEICSLFIIAVRCIVIRKKCMAE